MNWTKDGPYALRSDPYRIAKALSQDAWKYTVIFGKTILGHYATSDEAKAMCKEHARKPK